MAFDEIPTERQFEAIDWLANHGVHRILTHGGPMSESISDTLPRLKELIDYAANRITILPGGQITYENAEEIAFSQADIDPADPHARSKAYFTCRNWQFAHLISKQG